LLKEPIANILGMSGMGLDADRAVIAFHEDYSAYVEHLNRIRLHPLVRIEDIKSFLIDLTDKSQYLPLTFSELADYLTYNRLQKKQTRSTKISVSP
jgi:hypothetical protein